MTVSVISPTTLTDAMLVSTTVPEAVVSEYAGGTTYGLAARAGVTTGTAQIVYESLQAANTGHAPASSPTWWRVLGTVYAAYNPATTYADLDIVSSISTNSHLLYRGIGAGNVGNALTNTTKWTPYGPTNTWAMFDRKIGTVSTLASPITAVINSGRIMGFALLGLVGRSATVSLKSGTGGTSIFSATKSLDATIITDFYDWFFEDYVQLADWIVTGLPSQYNAPELTVSISSTAGNVSCGVCHFGRVTDLGAAQYGAKAGILDWSKKTRDSFGNYDVTEGAYSKRCTLSIMTEKADFQKVYDFLASARAQLSVFIGTEVDGYGPLSVYGYPKSFEVDVTYPTKHLCALEIEGVN